MKRGICIILILLLINTFTVNVDSYCKETKREKYLYNYKNDIIEFTKSLSNDYRDQFIKKMILNIMNSDSHVPYSLTISQSIIETGYGKYIKHNNLFGIKSNNRNKGSFYHRTIEYIKYVRTIRFEKFQKYNDFISCINDHSILMNNLYGIHISTKNYINKLDGYATDPKYKSKIQYLVDKYNLERLDSLQMLYRYGTNNLKLRSIIYN